MTDKITKNPLFISIIPNLSKGEGHLIPYHNSIFEATKILNWQHQVIYSGDENFSDLPIHWLKILEGGNLENKSNLWGNFAKLKDVIKLANSIQKYLQKIIKENPHQEIIIFIERFIHLQLFALYLALVNFKNYEKNIFIWILYRRDFHKHKTRFIYKILNNKLKKLVNPQHFQLLSDSQLLADSMSKYFEQKITVMPIPHTEFIDKNYNFNEENNNIICWWAGPPREEKGWQIIQKLSQSSSNLANNFTLVACQSSQLLKQSKKGAKIILTEDNLTRDNYVYWLSKADIILLPYDAIAYQERTSGIFTEAIIAGNIPVTTVNTWMARELLKFDLEELIIDWKNTEQIFEQIDKIFSSNLIHHKLAKMSEKYRTFHNLNNFANQFKSCYNTN